MRYVQVDVFTYAPLSGNGLAVLFPETPLLKEKMRTIAREFNQFESIFILPENRAGAYPARIFTVSEELPFAGHPVLGAAAALHRENHPEESRADIELKLPGRTVYVQSVRENGAYTETMNQGTADFCGTVDGLHVPEIARFLGLEREDIDTRYPVEVVSTGLPYLLVPVRRGIDRAGIAMEGFEEFLASLGAKFVYVFDPDSLECRTWDNTGKAEDVATGSAAGPLCASLVRHGRKTEGEVIRISQGKYTGRPSLIEGWIEAGDVFIRGGVAFFAAGECDI